MRYLLDSPVIVGQFVDTLVTSHKCLDNEHYYMRFKYLIDKLKEGKELAQSINVYGDRYHIFNNFMELGKFKIYSKGLRNFAYHLSNDNIDVYITDSDFLSSNHQLKIEFRAKFLFDVGYKKAWEFGKTLASRILGKNYKSNINRIDLASDIWGVNFEYTDSFRFKSALSSTDYLNHFSRFNRTQGFKFGSGDFVVRVYNKSLEIKKSQKHFFNDFWALNGFNSDSGIDVWRFETQFRRAKIKSLFSSDVDCEVDFTLSNLHLLWIKFIKGFKFVNLTQNEIDRINSAFLDGRFESARKIYQRRYNKQDDELDNLLQTWDNTFLNKGMLKEFKDYDSSNSIYLKRTVKALISQSFKLSGSFEACINAFEDIQKHLELENSSVVEYGLEKSFAKSKEIYNALESGKLPDYGYKILSNSSSTTKFTKDYVNLLSLIKCESKKIKLMDDYHYYYSRVNSLIKDSVSSVMSQELASDVIEFDGGFSLEPEHSINIPDIF